MSDCPLERARARLLKLKEKTGDPRFRADLAEAVADLDEFRRTAPREALEQWKLAHAPKWIGTKKQEAVIRLGIAQGYAGRDEIAALLSGDDDDPVSNEAVRAFMTRLRASLEKAKATATVKIAGRDGVYRTHDPSIQRYG